MKPLGEQIIEDGILTAAEVKSALTRQRELASEGQRKRLGEILLDMGLVSDADLQRAIDRQKLERT